MIYTQNDSVRGLACRDNNIIVIEVRHVFRSINGRLLFGETSWSMYNGDDHVIVYAKEREISTSFTKLQVELNIIHILLILSLQP